MNLFLVKIRLVLTDSCNAILSVMTLLIIRTECYSKLKLLKCLVLKLFCVFTDFRKKDLVFLLDSSDGSLQGFTNIKNFVQSIVADLNINPNMDRVAVVLYSNTTEMVFNLKRYSTLSEVLSALKGLRHKGGHPPNIGAALQYVKDHVFTSDSESRMLEGVPQILVILSGGRAGDDPRGAATALRETGVTSIAIGTGDADTLELQLISHTPNYALSISDYGALFAVKESVFSLIREASTPVQQTTVTKVAGKIYSSLKEILNNFLMFYGIIYTLH